MKSIGQIAKINSLILLLALTRTGLCAGDANSARLVEFLDDLSMQYTAMGYRVEINSGNFAPLLDSRECDQGTTLRLSSEPLKQQRNSLEVSCGGDQPWRFFLNVDIRIYGSTVTTIRNIARGTRIQAEDLTLSEVMINKGNYVNYREMAPIIGMVARQTIREGSMISPRQLIAPELIKRGDQVVIIADNGKISVRMNGIALEDGRKGEQISVRNSNSERIIKGYVEERGLINVIL